MKTHRLPQFRDPKLHALGLKAVRLRGRGAHGRTRDDSRRIAPVGGRVYDVAEAVKGRLPRRTPAPALCGHSRNLTDRQLRVLATTAACAGVNFYSSFLTGTDFTAIDDILRHMEYIADKAGIEAVALGSDFDGIDCGLEFGGYAGIPQLVEAIAAPLRQRQCRHDML